MIWFSTKQIQKQKKTKQQLVTINKNLKKQAKELKKNEKNKKLHTIKHTKCGSKGKN